MRGFLINDSNIITNTKKIRKDKKLPLIKKEFGKNASVKALVNFKILKTLVCPAYL